MEEIVEAKIKLRGRRQGRVVRGGKRGKTHMLKGKKQNQKVYLGEPKGFFFFILVVNIWLVSLTKTD